MEAVKASERSIDWHKYLKKLVSGVAFATDETDRASSRDMQFECLLVAVFQQSGCSTKFAEPDILVTHPDLVFGVAAKRPRRITSLEKKCRLGARQVSFSGRPGIVALDMSAALNPGFCITPLDRESATQFVEQCL